MAEIQFNTPYPNKYTPIQKAEEPGKFVSGYEIRNSNTVVSIETRPKRKRFKSRLVKK